MDILIPAAGRSSRMRGEDKLALEIDGIPLLRRTVLTAQVMRMDIIVTLRVNDPRRALIADLDVEIREVPDADEGLAASLRKGAEGAGALMVLPADMPDITRHDLMTMRAQMHLHATRILRACASDGTPGHPVAFPAFLRPEFQALRGDTGARPILQAHAERVLDVLLPGHHATTDLDTPEAWAAWRASQSGAG
ncbi:nucleotidyltransferase family protein [Stagnihabitans tardus]|uniref:NTP transferase domain-containing protein n=1 Tax=Stagnihabitans tardus TaxID=2699202 RepID=A0AAE5BX98_9RHOB|nr:nucleotidyltransferase family protein [Stagnihabitans tardus]NBZ89749.1 NTP transferase domain-containing protein [Stagnihabitans tardus]